MSEQLIDNSERERREAVLRHFQTTINTALPCKVKAVHSDSVDLELNILREFNNVEQPALTVLDVPVLFAGSGLTSISFPLDVGSTGLAIFAQRDIDNWLSGDTELPDTNRLHDFSDAIFLPGLRPSSGAPFPDNELVIKSGALSIKLSRTGQLEISNGLFDMVQLIKDLTLVLSTTTAPTSGGPVSSNAAVLQILAKLETF